MEVKGFRVIMHGMERDAEHGGQQTEKRKGKKKYVPMEMNKLPKIPVRT